METNYYIAGVNIFLIYFIKLQNKTMKVICNTTKYRADSN